MVLTSLSQAPLAQEESAGSEAAVSEAQAILGDAANLAGISEDDIKSRIKSARKLARSKDLPDDLKGSMEGFIAAARQELITRRSQAEQPAQEQQAEQPAQEQQAEQPAQLNRPSNPPPRDNPRSTRPHSPRHRNCSAGLALEAAFRKKTSRPTSRRPAGSSEAADCRTTFAVLYESYVAAARQELVTRQAQQQEQPAQEQQAEQPASRTGCRTCPRGTTRGR